MKRIWKKYLAVLCMAACVFSLMSYNVKAADKKDKLTIGEGAEEYIDKILQSYAAQGYDMGMDAEEYIQEYIVEGQFVPQLEQEYLNADRDSLKKTAKEDKTAESYLNETKDIGDYTGKVKDLTFDIDEKEESALLTGTIQFKKRDVTFSMELKMAEDVYVYSFEKVATFGEKMQKAALNTLMGMGTVFIVLIFISLLIGCFSFFNGTKEETPVPVAAPKAAPVPAASAEEDVTDDLELVAVISAAVAAAEGTSADGFTVRSIKRVSGRRRA